MFSGLGKTYKRSLQLALMGLMAVLVACAAPSGEGSSEEPKVTGQRVDPTGCHFLTGLSCDILKGANFQRIKNRQKPLTISTRCQAVAEAHAADMAKNRYLNHKSPTQGDFEERATRLGLMGYSGENIAYGYDASGVMNAWMNSSSHRANLLDPLFKSTGIGVALDRDGRPYYVQCFSSEPGN